MPVLPRQYVSCWYKYLPSGRDYRKCIKKLNTYTWSRTTFIQSSSWVSSSIFHFIGIYGQKVSCSYSHTFLIDFSKGLSSLPDILQSTYPNHLVLGCPILPLSLHSIYNNLLYVLNPLNAKLNPICHLLALSGAHPVLHVSRIRVNQWLVFTWLNHCRH
jgi:hypothetical protein